MRTTTLTVALFLLMLPATSAAQSQTQRIELEVQTSHVLSLFYFARCALGDPHTSDHLRSIYEEHADELDTDPLPLIRSAIAAGPANFAFHERETEKPKSRHQGQSLSAVLEGHAGESKSLEEFARRTAGVLPVAAQADLLRGLELLAPVHDAHVWRPSKKFLDRAARDLRRIADEVDAERRLAQVATFYGSRWPSRVPIRIYLVGVPGDVTMTHAHSAGAIEVVEVVEDDDMASRFAVLFHEICHSFYAAQPLALQNRIEAWFEQHPLPIASVAYHQMNEGLATALGNGWIAMLQKGESVLDESWYADEIIDRSAHALFPLVRHYVENGRTIDRDFVNRAVAFLLLKMPHAHQRPDVIFRQMALFVGAGFDVGRAVDELRRNFRVHSLYTSAPLSNPRTLQNYMDTAELAVFVLQRDQLNDLEVYPFSKLLVDKLRISFERGTPFALVDDSGSRLKVFIGADDHAGLANMLEALASVDRLESGTVIRP